MFDFAVESCLTQEREISSTDELHNKIRRRVFLSYKLLKSRKRRICFPTSYKSTYVAIPAIRPFCHSFCYSAIPSAIPPFRHSAIPPFHHSAISTIPAYKLPTYIQTYEVEKWDLNGLGRHFFNEINY
jgi:hypothetical protein